MTSSGTCRRPPARAHAGERRDGIDALLDPLLDPAVPRGDRAALVVNAFQAVLAARLAPLLGTVPGGPVGT